MGETLPGLLTTFGGSQEIFVFFAAGIAASGCNARSKKRREGEPQLVQVRLHRQQACNARSKKRREGEEAGT